MSPLKGKEKSAASAAWLKRNDYVQLNVWLPRELRDEFSALCAEARVTKRGVQIGLIESWCQDRREREVSP